MIRNGVLWLVMTLLRLYLALLPVIAATALAACFSTTLAKATFLVTFGWRLALYVRAIVDRWLWADYEAWRTHHG